MRISGWSSDGCSSDLAPQGGGPIAIPGMVRGLGLLQSRYGKLRWESVVVPAEQVARFGEGASRAFIRSVTDSDPALAQNPALAEILGGPGGSLPAEIGRAHV